MTPGQPGGGPLPPGARDGVDVKLVAAVERLGQAVRVQLAAVARAHGLSVTQLQLLGRLQVDPPDRGRVGALAAELDVTMPTVSDSLATLERKGLVRRAREPGDRRGVRIELTSHGEVVARAAEEWRARVQALLPVGDTEKQHTLAVLSELIAEMHARGLVSVARLCVTCRFFTTDTVSGGSRCALLDIALGPSDLRVDCPEHEPIAA